jgi:hypothetical protein
MLENYNTNCRNNRNISIFTSISFHFVFTQLPFLFFQHNQQYYTLLVLPIIPCTHKKISHSYYFSKHYVIFFAELHIFLPDKRVVSKFLNCHKIVKITNLQYYNIGGVSPPPPYTHTRSSALHATNLQMKGIRVEVLLVFFK